MALSPKQLAMAWINSKLAPENIDPENHELFAIYGGSIPNDKLVKAKEFIFEDLAKVKVRYQQYTEKYVGEANVSSIETEEPINEEGEELAS